MHAPLTGINEELTVDEIFTSIVKTDFNAMISTGRVLGLHRSSGFSTERPPAACLCPI